jgi:hypothetical protein
LDSDLNNEINLERGPKWKIGGDKGAAGVKAALPEDLDQQLRGAVGDPVRFVEPRRAVDHDEHAGNLRYVIEVTDRGLEDAKQFDGNVAGGRPRSSQGNFPTNLAHEQLIAGLGQPSREEDVTATANPRRELGDVPIRDRRWDVGKFDSKLSKARLRAHDDIPWVALAQSFVTASKRSMSAASFRR